MKKLIGFGLVAGLVAPYGANAQVLVNVTTLIGSIGDIIDFLLPIVVTLAVLYFFWGLAQFILNSDSDEARSEGRSKMIWGIVALFVIVSVWGLVGFLGSALGIDQGGKAPVPGVKQVPGTSGEATKEFGR